MEKSILKKAGFMVSILSLAASLTACSNGSSPKASDDVEVQQSAELPQSSFTDESAAFPLEGSFLANTADPENVELANACLQLQNNLNALQTPLADLDAQMQTVEATSPERGALGAEYIDLFKKATTKISNEEVVGLWNTHVENLEKVNADIENDNADQLDDSAAKFQASGEAVNNLCFSGTQN